MSEQDELAALDAELAAFERRTTEVAARRTPSALDEKRAAVAAAKRKAEDAEQIEQLEKRYGKLGERLASASTPLGMLVVQKPMRQAFKEFTDAIHPVKGVSFEDSRLFVERCLVFPDRAKFLEIVNEFPGAVVPLANALQKLGGAVESDVAGKS